MPFHSTSLENKGFINPFLSTSLENNSLINLFHQNNWKIICKINIINSFTGNQNTRIEITMFEYRLYWVIFYYNPEMTTEFGDNQIIFNGKFGFMDIFEEYMKIL